MIRKNRKRENNKSAVEIDRTFCNTAKHITKFSYALRNVRFSLIENGITETDIALSVVFTDREGDQVRKLYETKGWKLKHHQDISETLQAKD